MIKIKVKLKKNYLKIIKEEKTFKDKIVKVILFWRFDN